MDIKWGSYKGEKCAEAKNRRQLLVSNFSWRTGRGICLHHVIDAHKNQRHAAKRYTSLRKKCQQDPNGIRGRTALDPASDDHYTNLCSVISSYPYVEFRPLVTPEQQVFIESLLCRRCMKTKVWLLGKQNTTFFSSPWISSMISDHFKAYFVLVFWGFLI